MNAERRARVESFDGDVATLDLAPGCSDCSGCSGRCALLGTRRDARRFELPLARFDMAPHAGQSVRLYLPAAALLAQAGRGYGLPLAGLVLGAVGGHLLALTLNQPPDIAAIVFAAAGTLTGVGVSKRAVPPSCRVAPARESGDEPIPPNACNEDAPT